MQEDEDDKIFNDEPIGIEVVKKTRDNFFVSTFKFVKKHKIASIITVCVIGIIIGLFFIIPVIDINGLKLVNLNASFRLEENQTAKLKINNVSVKIVHFTNDTCPIPGTCFGSGQTTAVEYELVVDGKKHATGSMTPASGSDYQIETVSSDYKTHAMIKITKVNK